jgi:L-ascorbate metabolism protein UlaG (beta-lactamase superfamily)
VSPPTPGQPTDLAVTWWGHATATVELGRLRIATDPVLVDRLFHLRRYGVTPRAEASTADLVLLSHLHGDHIHLRSLRRFGRDVPVVAPHGAKRLLRRLGLEAVRTVAPGDALDVAGARVEVLPATHDDRRSPLSQLRGPALGFRVQVADRSFWFPGDSGLRDDMADVAPVDLALVPVGGWGPTLGPLHMDPDEGAEAVRRVGARWAVPVHWGTFWPVALSRITPARHTTLFVTPGPRFADALATTAPDTQAQVLGHGERAVLG